MISLAYFTAPKYRLPVWLIGRPFDTCLLLLITRFRFLRDQLGCSESTKRLYLLSCKWFEGSLGWNWRGFSWCLRTLDCFMTSLFSHFNPLLNLDIRNCWILPLPLIIVILVLYLSDFLFSCSLEWSYFACIPNGSLYLLILIFFILFSERGL